MLYGRQKTKPKLAPYKYHRWIVPGSLVLLVTLWLIFMVNKYMSLIEAAHLKNDEKAPVSMGSLSATSTQKEVSKSEQRWNLPVAFNNVVYRAQEMAESCQKMDTNFTYFDKASSMPVSHNESLASLPTFGFIDDIKRWKKGGSVGIDQRFNDPTSWQCSIPKWKECNEETFTVVFMAYNPDRLQTCFLQMKKMLTDSDWKTVVHEIVLVWNGPRHIDESEMGVKLLEFAKEHPLRIAYPLKMGFENDLMNRYHPAVVNVTTKAILYYDDDGPFYTFKAVEGGFELWKRHANAQVGAMSREISLGKRQQSERNKMSSEPNDRLFTSHCDNMNDKVEYNFRYFANFDANMVLPSGSFLHSNYLCFIWHPVLQSVREFVRAHPVHPDDVAVSMIVSQLAGRAPRVYSRRLKADSEKLMNGEEDTKRRRLLLEGDLTGLVVEDIDEAASLDQQFHRRLMFGINWDAGSGMNNAKQRWADMRTQAINSLVRYFGSLNSGSIGWCEGTQWYDPKRAGKCEPIMARQGWLPWMEADGEPKEDCP